MLINDPNSYKKGLERLEQLTHDGEPETHPGEIDGLLVALDEFEKVHPSIIQRMTNKEVEQLFENIMRDYPTAQL